MCVHVTKCLESWQKCTTYVMDGASPKPIGVLLFIRASVLLCRHLLWANLMSRVGEGGQERDHMFIVS